ncbi:MAG: zinc/manganese transport system substrate-binding protein [Chloroflexota bacterium]|jgi:zinc/manganese transport system substrate-binding protein/manganese/iron transport system substrate-binding protein|nr:zinc/manganese transport system substrate-binding protein [Chloroflexota bacterium]
MQGKRIGRSAALLLAIAVVIPMLSLAAPFDQPRPGGLRVLATTTQIQDFVTNVGGDRITMVPVLGGDDDPHEYQPTADDARNVANADVIFQNGVGLETWLDKLAQNAKPSTLIVKLGEAASIPIRAGDAEEPAGDPHVWMDPTNVQLMVLVIRDTLSRADPANGPVYATNAAAYTGQLTQLDNDIRGQWAILPPEQRKLVTNHDAFGYYVARYGLIFVGSVIPSLSTEAEPSAAETQQLIQNIQAQDVKAIFTESSINPRLAAQISQQTGVRIYSSLYGDSLGQPGSPGDTYVKMMLYNTDIMIAGMSGR